MVQQGRPMTTIRHRKYAIFMPNNKGMNTHTHIYTVFFFLGGRRGTRTPKHFVNLTGEIKNFKMLEFPLKQLQTYYGYLCELLSFM
jgi:hypothetical protein